VLEGRRPHVGGGDELDVRTRGQGGQQLTGPNADADQSHPQWRG
jgi:hypothetical protein